MQKIYVILFLSILVVFYGSLEGFAMTHQQKNEPKKGAQCGLPMSDSELKKILTPEQYRIMRQNGTEAAFQNAFWKNKKHGIYVDVITGEPLFSSADKFDSGTGWPSFFQPIEKDKIVEKTDASSGMIRVEVRSSKSNSHLGHVFPDGPQPTGLRYCINSAALKFIPVEDLEKKGYGKYLPLFQKIPTPPQAIPSTSQVAVFGGGCFWGVESAFQNVPGVLKTTVGYTGGSFKNPTYEQVCSHQTGHAEALRIEFDPSKISYEKLLEIFWSIHDPTTPNQQGPDVGPQYRSVIFYENEAQKNAAQTLKGKLERSKKFKKPIVTEIIPAAEFYPAEEYHQQYFKKKGIKPFCLLPRH